MRVVFAWIGVASLAATAAIAVGCSSDSERECPGESADALRTCAQAETLRDVDVSYYQGDVDWVAVRSSGRAFAFARVSDGLNFPDTKFAANWPAMKAAGITRGTYQFFRPAQDAAAQAKLLLDKIDAAGGLQPGDLPPVLDIESADGQTPAVIQAKAKAWLVAVAAAIGQKPIVYTAAFMSPNLGTALSGYTLWVANYGATCPLMPDGWTTWSFWQNSDEGNVPGIVGNVDTNFFNGNASQLAALTLKSGDGDAGDGGSVDPGPETGDARQTVGSANPPQTTVPVDPCGRTR